jgi:hypothetical protein
LSVEIEAPPPIACPPHYWLIEKLDLHHQHWTCQRCGVEHDHQDHRKQFTRWTDPHISRDRA